MQSMYLEKQMCILKMHTCFICNYTILYTNTFEEIHIDFIFALFKKVVFFNSPKLK